MPQGDTTIVRIRRNWFDGQAGYDAVTAFRDETTTPTVARVDQAAAEREFREHKDTPANPQACPIERATEDDLAAFEAMVAAGSAKKKGGK